eukprot:12714205-Alexandrium_andersonii.AAC.1
MCIRDSPPPPHPLAHISEEHPRPPLRIARDLPGATALKFGPDESSRHSQAERTARFGEFERPPGGPLEL